MIGYLEGSVIAVRPTYIILTANGVGYKLFTSKDTLARLSEGADGAFWTHLAVRETALDLYGFTMEETLRFFELLLTVSGIGPKSALAILDIATVETLRSAISQGNSSYLTKVSGIGRKTAEKIVIELRDKVGAGSEKTLVEIDGDEEALEALKTLGYSQQEAREALRKIPATITGASARVRESLRHLGNSK